MFYIMECFCMNEEFPYGKEPYHYSEYVLAELDEAGHLGLRKRFDARADVGRIARQLAPFGALIPERHPLLPDAVNICGDVEKYCGLPVSSELYALLEQDGMLHSS